ncbi:enolase C-terminal domain-like protein [Streptomyces triticiradicis]|uniref:Dipeptide epimerase n=1 Tax=Streptomyces triticiradicis TaxID=2651189 RepID=A0A7J5D4Z1_9ACTN|nr:enolase C-terminal domain-like protein [Streptomyces triticiradicis]KAB1979146.1 dipeptide epimerase [Streptomyces triticiradicis]
MTRTTDTRPAATTQVAHHRIEVSLAEPFTSNTGVTTHVRQSLLRLRWEGLTGYGTALAADSGELAACVPLLADATPYDLRRVLDALRAAEVRPAVAAAVDLALHDLLGKAVGRPLHRLLGLGGLPLAPTALSIGAGSEEELLSKGVEFGDWPILKLKLTPDDDGSRAGVLRSVYGGRIWVDGNGSWTPEQALDVAGELARHGVELLEQPVPRGDLESLGQVHRRSPVPVVADEDCVLPEDVLPLRGRASAVNIKLTKCGGLRAALDMITLARQSGLRVLLGCKTESALGVTAMAQLAPLADLLDLDGHLGLLDDPFSGVVIDRGRIVLPDDPGLGARSRPDSENTWEN